MKGDVVALGEYQGRKAAAWIKDGLLHDLFVDPPRDVAPKGTILAGRADRPAKSLGGQFVHLPHGRGLLRRGQVSPGDPVLVQVTRYADPGKAIPLTSKIEVRGRYLVLTPGAPGVNISRKIKDPSRRAALMDLITEAAPDVKGAVVRSDANDAEDSVILAECNEMNATMKRLTSADMTSPHVVARGPDAHNQARTQWPAVRPDSFDAFDVDEMIDAMRRPEVALGQGSAFIEATRALVAIDVNTGADFSPAAALKVNLALIEDLPRQLRCRGLGGQIVLDLAPVRRDDRSRIEAAVTKAFASDEADTRVVGWSPLGLLELVRSRIRCPL